MKLGFRPLNIVGKFELSRIHVKSLAFDLFIDPPLVLVSPREYNLSAAKDVSEPELNRT